MSKTTHITHYVMETAFHGGGIVSRHRSAHAADAAAARIQSHHHRECACGGGVVVAVEEYDDLPLPCDASSP